MKESRWGQDVVRLNRDGLQRSQDQDRALGQTKRDALIDHVLGWRQNQARTRTMHEFWWQAAAFMRPSLVLLWLTCKYQRQLLC